MYQGQIPVLNSVTDCCISLLRDKYVICRGSKWNLRVNPYKCHYRLRVNPYKCTTVTAGGSTHTSTKLSLQESEGQSTHTSAAMVASEGIRQQFEDPTIQVHIYSTASSLGQPLFFTHVIISERNRRLKPMAYMAIVSHSLPTHSITCTALLSCSCCLVDFASGECSVGHSKIKFQYGKTYQQKCTKRRPS